MRVPFIDLRLHERSIQKSIQNAVRKVLDSRQYILGPLVSQFERAVCEQLGSKEAVAVASGSDALYLSLLACGVGQGDEVITTPFTFFATAGAISRTGATPVFADIDTKTFNIDVSCVVKKITDRTKAIVPVHLYGLPCDMEAIMGLAEKHRLHVVEDAAQAYGAEVRGRKVGTIGDYGCLSFYPTKNLGGVGDGGMILTSSADGAKKLRCLREHGSATKYIHELIGINSRLDEIQAAVLLVKMKKVDEWNMRRAQIAARYAQGLKGLPVQLPSVPRGYSHAYHLYSILTDRQKPLLAFLGSRQIGAAMYYPLPLHLQTCYKGLGYRKGDLPVAEKAAEQVISLPMYVGMSMKETDAVIRAIKDFYKAGP